MKTPSKSGRPAQADRVRGDDAPPASAHHRAERDNPDRDDPDRDDRPPREHDDKYWDEEWRKSEERLKKRDEVIRRRWPGWAQEEGRKAQYTAWLVVPCDASDYGLRPLPAGSVYYASPFIWVDSPSGTGIPVAGAENHLLVRVFNLGAASAAPTRLDFFWADPSVGLGAADAHYIGTEMVEVQPMSSLVVRCRTPWVPSYLNGGHECVFVQSDNFVLDPLLQPFAPWADRHVGQKNLTVLPPATQNFLLWIPTGVAGVRGQLRATVLRGRLLPPALEGRKPLALRFGDAAMRLLSGLWPRQATVLRGEGQPRMRWVTGAPIAADQVIESVRLNGTTRRRMAAMKQDCGCPPPRPGDCDAPPAGELGTAGTPVLDVDGHPDLMRQVEVRLRAIDLQRDEFIVVNLSYLAAERLQGGYVLVLAHGGWFKDSSTNASKEETMQNQGPQHRDDLQQLVVEQYPQARLTLEIARVLQKHLPITTEEQLERAAEYGSVCGQTFAKGMVQKMGVKDLLPIKDSQDLVRKVAGMLTIAAAQGGSGAPLNDPAANAARLMLEGTDRPTAPIPTFHFAGGSVFGSTPSKGE
jgi:hypothetical protein